MSGTIMDRLPGQPAYRPPPGSWDTHCHIFGPKERFPFAPERTYTPEDAPKEALQALHDRLGLDHAVIVQAGCHGRDHTAVIDAIRAGNGKRRGIALLGADVEQAEFTRLHAEGFRGVRFNFVSHLGRPAAPEVIREVASMAAGLGWHVLVHLQVGQMKDLAPFLRSLPAEVVLDHMARPSAADGVDHPGFTELQRLLEEPRFWVKVSGGDRISAEGPPYRDAVPFAATLVDSFPRQVLWGTDWPHPNVRQWPDDAALMDLVPLIATTPEQRQALLVDNPRRLYA
jgi:2-pyrone-4,6-dicarboxylate lactonase